MVSVAGLGFGEDAARGEIQAQLQDLMGEAGAGAVQGLLASVREPAEGLTATAVGLVLLLVGATPVFCRTAGRARPHLARAGTAALDRLAHAGSRSADGLRHDPRGGLLLIVSLLTSAMLAAVGRRLGPVFGGWQTVVETGVRVSSRFIDGPNSVRVRR